MDSMEAHLAVIKSEDGIVDTSCYCPECIQHERPAVLCMPISKRLATFLCPQCSFFFTVTYYSKSEQ